jgi:hypothetical protein
MFTKEPIVETRKIKLPQGDFLTIEMTQSFIDRIKQHFGLLETQVLEDDHVRMYVWGAFNTAVTKSEQGMNNES